MGWDLNTDLFDCLLKVDYEQWLVTRQAGDWAVKCLCLNGKATSTAPVSLSVFRQVGAHLWHRGPVVSRHERDSNPGMSTPAFLRQAP